MTMDLIWLHLLKFRTTFALFPTQYSMTMVFLKMKDARGPNHNCELGLESPLLHSRACSSVEPLNKRSSSGTFKIA